MGRLCRLVVRGKDWYCNIPVTRIERMEDVVYTYLDGDFTKDRRDKG